MKVYIIKISHHFVIHICEIKSENRFPLSIIGILILKVISMNNLWRNVLTIELISGISNIV